MAFGIATWHALAAWATIWTLGYIYRPTERVVFTSGVATASWAITALTGGTAVKYAQDGTPIAQDLGALQYVAAGMSVLSFLVLLLYWWDVYPPQTDDPTPRGDSV